MKCTPPSSSRAPRRFSINPAGEIERSPRRELERSTSADEKRAPFRRAPSASASRAEGPSSEVEYIFWQVRNSEALTRNIIRPMEVAMNRRERRELAFIRAYTYVCLRLHDEQLLSQLEDELSDSKSQMQLAYQDVNLAATNLQRVVRGMLRKRSVARCLAVRKLVIPAEDCRIASVCVFGSINMDMRAETTGALPLAGRGVATTEVGKFSSAPGGKGANEAVAVARLGLETHLIGRVGRDDMGRSLIGHLQSVGGGKLSTSQIQLQDGVATGVAVQVVSTAEKQKLSLVCAGANGCVDDKDINAACLLLVEKQVRMLLLQLEVPTAAVRTMASEARELGCIVAFKASPLPLETIKDVQKLLDYPSVDLLFVNEFEAPTLIESAVKPLTTVKQAEECAAMILERWPLLRCVVITSRVGQVLRWRALTEIVKGNESFWFGEEEAARDLELVVPRRTHDIVDVIGAADASVGGFVAALCRGLSATQAMLWAHASGSLSTLRPGAQEAMPTLQELSVYLRCEFPGLSERELMLPLDQTKERTDSMPPELQPKLLLLQNPLHLGALRADVCCIPAVGDASRASVRVQLAKLLCDMDATKHTPVQRAYECWKLTRSPPFKEILKLLLAIRLLLAATGELPPLQEPSDTEEAKGLPGPYKAASDSEETDRVKEKLSSVSSAPELLGMASPPTAATSGSSISGSEPAAISRLTSVPGSVPQEEPRTSEEALGVPEPISRVTRKISLERKGRTSLLAKDIGAATSRIQPDFISDVAILNGNYTCFGIDGTFHLFGWPLPHLSQRTSTDKAGETASARRSSPRTPPRAPGASPPPRPEPAGASMRAAEGVNQAAAEIAAAVALALLQPPHLHQDLLHQEEDEPCVLESLGVAVGLVEQFCRGALSPEDDPAHRGASLFRKALFDARSPTDGSTLLCAAAHAGATRLARSLIERLPPGGAETYCSTLNHAGESAMHLAAHARNLEMAELLLSKTTLPISGEQAKDRNGLTPLMRCGPEFAQKLKRIEENTRCTFFCFISHYKAEGAMQARWLKNELERELGQQVFLDSDNLFRINEIEDHVRESHVMLLLQTRNVLTRPFCILELLIAIKARKPVVAVHIVGSELDYDFEHAQSYLENLDTRMGPEARAMLIEHGVDMAEARDILSTIIPQVKSIALDTHASKRILTATVLDIGEAIQVARTVEVDTFKDAEGVGLSRKQHDRNAFGFKLKMPNISNISKIFSHQSVPTSVRKASDGMPIDRGSAAASSLSSLYTGGKKNSMRTLRDDMPPPVTRDSTSAPSTSGADAAKKDG